MRAPLTQVRVAVLRRRGQTATVLLICLLAGSVATMAVTLLVRSTQPWDDAFARVAGPHLLFHFDASRVTEDQLRATESLAGVTAAGPPRPTTLVSFERANQKGTLQLIGRDSPGGTLDRLTLFSGRWPQHPGELAVTHSTDSSFPFQPRVGDSIRPLTNKGASEFKVVGEVIDIAGHGAMLDFSSGSLAAWVLPGDIPSLVDGAQVRLGYEMAYRFNRAATSEELAADQRQVEAALPPNSETLPVANWLEQRLGSIWFIDILSSLILAFTVFAVIAVAVIVGSSVAGSVLSSYREIGIIKALGFKPLEVVAVYVGQMAVPAAVGALLGIPLGEAVSRPFLHYSASTLGLPETATFDPVVDLLVVVGVVALVIVAAALPALRAGATDSIRAMTLGSAPPATRRSRLAAGLRLLGAPRPLSLGAGDAFSRPVRAALTVTALGIGIASAIFAIGFRDTAIRVLTSEPALYGYGQDVVVQRYPAITDPEVTARLAEQPETGVVVATRAFVIRVTGHKDPYTIYAMRGDAGTLGYKAVQGRWFAGPGEAVIGLNVSKEAGLNIGDSFSGSLAGGPALRLRVVGLVNDLNTNGNSIRIGWDTLSAAMPAAGPDTYLVRLSSGADPTAYAHRIAAIAPDFLDARATSLADLGIYTSALWWMIGAFALVLMLIAAAGVFNATLLLTRERVHDIAILKSLGLTSPQTLLMVAGSTLVLIVVAVAIGVPGGVWLQSVIWGSMAGTLGALIAPEIAPASLAIALVGASLVALSGAVLPGRWAAATPVSEVLRSE